LGPQDLRKNVEKEYVDRFMGYKIKLGQGEHQRSELGRALVHSFFSLYRQSPNFLAAAGITLMMIPVFMETIYQNYYLAAGTLCLFMVWVVANLLKGRFSKKSKEWQQQRKVLIAMSLCVVMGLMSLAYYEMKMPKYEVALIKKTLYPIPAHLSKKQLLEMGAECNTYGNTLCSHDVFARIVKKDSRDYAALANLAIAQSHLGFHQQALVNFKRAIDNGVNTYDTYRFYGQSLESMGQTRMAVQAFKKSLQLNPKQRLVKERIKQIQGNS
jgi:tetratricopeptide (TPR) repeat protein